MAGITLRTARQVVPMIYAYTTPEIARHNGWTKIGYTEQSVDKRLKQQTHTADVLYHDRQRTGGEQSRREERQYELIEVFHLLRKLSGGFNNAAGC